MKPERLEKIKHAAKNRQLDIAVVLENVHDSHNIGAVMRTCDSVGIQSVYLLNTEEIPLKNIVLGKRTSSGSRKWIDVKLFTDREKCFTAMRQKYAKVLSTHIGSDAVSLYELDLTQSVALLFGNERDGVTPKTLELCDGNFLIPQYGFVQSLNISVSCAITLYEASRQREKAGKYGSISNTDEQALVDKFSEIHNSKKKGRKPVVE